MKTGGKNWQSDCGADFGFVELFYNDYEHLNGHVRQSVVDRINCDVVTAKQYIEDYITQSKQESVKGVQSFAEGYNQGVLEREGINPADGIPAYVEAQLMQTGTQDAMLQQVERDSSGEYDFYRCQLFEAIEEHGITSYLTDDTINCLNGENGAFSDYRAYKLSKLEREARELEAKERAKYPKPNRDYSTPFELDEDGQMVDDGFGFEEYD